jgi:hypothetical protein
MWGWPKHIKKVAGKSLVRLLFPSRQPGLLKLRNPQPKQLRPAQQPQLAQPQQQQQLGVPLCIDNAYEHSARLQTWQLVG